MNKKAFTLIEIVVVAVIMGILGMMGFPSMLKMMQRSYAQDAMHNLIAIYAAEQNYAQNNLGAYLTCDNTCINSATGLNLAVASNGGITYSCDKTTKICTASSGAASAAGTFSMNISINANHPINALSTPVYCDILANPTYTNHNPCCTTAGGTPNAACP